MTYGYVKNFNLKMLIIRRLMKNVSVIKNQQENTYLVLHLNLIRDQFNLLL